MRKVRMNGISLCPVTAHYVLHSQISDNMYYLLHLRHLAGVRRRRVLLVDGNPPLNFAWEDSQRSSGCHFSARRHRRRNLGSGLSWRFLALPVRRRDRGNARNQRRENYASLSQGIIDAIYVKESLVQYCELHVELSVFLNRARVQLIQPY